MAHVFKSEKEVKKIIREVDKRNHTVGLLLKLAFFRNFRVGDVRFARADHFQKNNGIPKVYLWNDKKETDEWFPIPHSVYEEIKTYIDENGLDKNDFVFSVECKKFPQFNGHGPVCHEFVEDQWYRACKRLGFYSETVVLQRRCDLCIHALPDKKCKVFGLDKIRRRNTVHKKTCIREGRVKRVRERHPRVHESIRGVGAISKIRKYMDQGLDPSVAKEKVFQMSNWTSRKSFEMYMDKSFEKEIGDYTFMKDFGEESL